MLKVDEAGVAVIDPKGTLTPEALQDLHNYTPQAGQPVDPEIARIVNDGDTLDVRKTLMQKIQEGRSVLLEHPMQLEDYLKACKFVNYLSGGETAANAWTAVFPERVRDIEEKIRCGECKGGLVSAVARRALSYKNTKRVSQIIKNTQVPVHLLYQDLLMEAIEIQIRLARDEDMSGTVRQKAAESLMVNLAAPESVQAPVLGTDDIAELAKLADRFAQGARATVIEGEASLVEIEEQSRTIGKTVAKALILTPDEG